MSSTVETRTPAETPNAAAQAAAAGNEKPVIIATRQRCEADGVGLSHYILMDKTAASE